MATMQDVAKAAGVSLKTVSRVVNEEQGVRPETVARVQSAVAALGFRPNAAARSLRGGHSLPLVGLVIGDLANPFYSGIARGVEEIAAQHGYLVITGSSEEHASREDDLLTTLRRQHISGLLIVPAPERGPLQDEARIPIVCLDRPAPNGECDAVIVDNRLGVEVGVAHLIAQGHRRIGMVGDVQSLYTASERLKGFRAAIFAAGIPADESLVALGASDVGSAERCARQLLDQPDPPTAIFAMNNRACVGVIRAIVSSSANVAVVGFDEMELGGVVAPLRASIVQDPIEMGRVGSRLLFARIAGDTTPCRTVVLPTRLVVYAQVATAVPGRIQV